jgi:hypothetical protein
VGAAVSAPDRALDAQVAEIVLGWTYHKSKHGHWVIETPEGDRFEPLFGRRIFKFDPETGEKLAGPLWHDGLELPAWSSDLGLAWQLAPTLYAAGFRHFQADTDASAADIAASLCRAAINVARDRGKTP